MNIASKFAPRPPGNTPPAKQPPKTEAVTPPPTALPVIEAKTEVVPVPVPVPAPVPVKAEPLPIAALFDDDFTAEPTRLIYEYDILDTRNKVKNDVQSDDIARDRVSYTNSIGKEVQIIIAGTIDGIREIYGRPFDAEGNEIMKYRYVGKLNGFERCMYE
jgi:hypothetical protein